MLVHRPGHASSGERHAAVDLPTLVLHVRQATGPMLLAPPQRREPVAWQVTLSQLREGHASVDQLQHVFVVDASGHHDQVPVGDHMLDDSRPLTGGSVRAGRRPEAARSRADRPRLEPLTHSNNGMYCCCSWPASGRNGGLQRCCQGPS